MESSGAGRGAGGLEALPAAPFRPAEANRSLRPSLGRWKALSFPAPMPSPETGCLEPHKAIEADFVEPGFPERCLLNAKLVDLHHLPF